MQIFISINYQDKNLDISVDENNTINNVLDVLCEKNLINSYKKNIYSGRLQSNVPINLSFKQALIKSGDVLYV